MTLVHAMLLNVMMKVMTKVKYERGAHQRERGLCKNEILSVLSPEYDAFFASTEIST
jgi:hypothetical protein